MSKKGQFRYYIQIWDVGKGAYAVPRSASSVALELGLDEKAFPATSRTGAFLIGEELRRRGGAPGRKTSLLYADYCADFWDWKTSSYIQGKLDRGQRIGKEYVSHNAAYVENHIRPAFPALHLADVRPFMLEDFALSLKRGSGLGNRSINAILVAASAPLHEAARLGLIDTDPAASIRKLGNDTQKKGIPTEEEVRGLLTLEGLDHRTRAAILLGAACALRIGEVQALKLEQVGEKTLTVASSWSKLEGTKCTKTGHVRIVPLPKIVRDVLLALDEESPHGRGGFLIYGLKPDAPLDVRGLERLFDDALVRLSLRDKYADAKPEELRRALETWKARRVTFHSLRHFCNAMLRGSVPDEKLHMLTGHSTEAMTNHYDHATEADLTELRDAQEARILPFLKAAGGEA
jgi:integrase